MKTIKKIWCWLFGHDLYLNDYDGLLEVGDTYCSRCGKDLTG